jgi:hypothetical protein
MREHRMGTDASLGKEAVLADSGRAGEVDAGAGRVRGLTFLSILRVLFHVPDLRAIEVLVCRTGFPRSLIGLGATGVNLRSRNLAFSRGSCYIFKQ